MRSLSCFFFAWSRAWSEVSLIKANARPEWRGAGGVKMKTGAGIPRC